MSDQEKSGTTMVEQTPGSRHKPYRSAEVKDGHDLPNIRSKAPAVPSLSTRTSEELKIATVNERRETDAALASDKQEQNLTRKFSSKKRIPSPESIRLTPLEVETKKDEKIGQPIPAQVELAAAPSRTSIPSSDKLAAEKKGDEDSITEDIGELRAPEVITKHSEWSEEGEAGGLPRSDSCASRVSRAVRQLFCCGVRYEAPSEHNVSAREGYYASGI